MFSLFVKRNIWWGHIHTKLKWHKFRMRSQGSFALFEFYFVLTNGHHRDYYWCHLSSGLGAAPIPDDKNTNTNLYGANSWRQNKIKSLLSSTNEPLGTSTFKVVRIDNYSKRYIEASLLKEVKAKANIYLTAILKIKEWKFHLCILFVW